MKLALSLGIVLMLCFNEITFGAGETLIGRYPKPLAETDALLSRYLQQERFSVNSTLLGNGDIELRGTATGKPIRVLLRAHSPLATEVRLLETSALSETVQFKESWELFLAKMERFKVDTVPEDIRALTESVVCISTPAAAENKLNFTGFLIDQGGTILTIAHDIDKQRVFKLNFPGGEVGEGRVAKIDVTKDLTVIQSKHRDYALFLSLKKGRVKLNYGERLFMLTCSSNGSVQIQSGTVDKPKANVGGQKLWQVNLENVFLGSSGSPVVDENSRLVGVVKGRFRGTDSRGFLIPLDTVRAFVGMGKK